MGVLFALEVCRNVSAPHHLRGTFGGCSQGHPRSAHQRRRESSLASCNRVCRFSCKSRCSAYLIDVCSIEIILLSCGVVGDGLISSVAGHPRRDHRVAQGGDRPGHSASGLASHQGLGLSMERGPVRIDDSASLSATMAVPVCARLLPRGSDDEPLAHACELQPCLRYRCRALMLPSSSWRPHDGGWRVPGIAADAGHNLSDFSSCAPPGAPRPSP
jgi:hypothetical protein